ncbi:receptor kinase-like protein Xa21 [Ananas comosus]|uniref:non-specific serine/threonine protein kinase n=1 Tax=Ananas comosus TaxID=4615 RepID=A0A6P5G3N7_ANACO|nr:receptor kinase-like protein Xa21 [Ananas comosus]
MSLLYSRSTFVILVALLILFSCHHHRAISSRAHAAAALLDTTNAATDRLALLSFKSLLSDPSHALSSWNESTPFCRWQGIECGGRRHPDRVTALSLSSLNLAGAFPPSVANLTFLKRLDLSNNQLDGQVPVELGRLSRLQYLNLSHNSLRGSIPAALGRCSALETIALGYNQLEGEIPPDLANLSSLTYLNPSHNTLSGQIPLSLGNLTSLRLLDLTRTQLSGAIPSTLGRLSNLKFLYLTINNLSGTIPPSIWNISSLVHLLVGGNERLTGRIPQDVGETLPRLEALFMYQNQFYGPIPASLANATRLSDIEINTNFFSGTIPPEIGSLQLLQKLLLYKNSLEVKEPDDWGFFKALTNCTNLQYLLLHNNKLSGLLPTSISNLSVSIEVISLGSNSLSGSVPEGIGNLVNLNHFSIVNNTLTGSLPASIGMLQNSQILDFSYNNFTGEIPSTIGNLSRLWELYLYSNGFSGNIPKTLGNLRHLQQLDLSYNKLSGMIPEEVMAISSLSAGLVLSHNLLVGQIPSEVGNLKNLEMLDVQGNKLSGTIPSTLGECQVLQFLYAQMNSLQGSIPSSFRALKAMQELDLASNNLSGEIPSFFEDYSSLYFLNLSFNNFEGEVPKTGVFSNISAFSVQGNKKLCGGIKQLHLPPCNIKSPHNKHTFRTLIIVILVIVASVIISSILLLFFFFYSRCWPESARDPSTSLKDHLRISYSELVKATDGFSATNLIGTGSYGSVYKGVLEGEGEDSVKVVAVKVLNLQTPGSLKSFTAECEAMKNLRHRNLVRIITSCSSSDYNGNEFKALVFEFMPNGSLEDWLHHEASSQAESKHLSLLQRLNIAIDVASALDYLHCHSGTPIVHRDLKPNNVLLDDDMVAHVGDFGLARFRTAQKSASSIGFIDWIRSSRVWSGEQSLCTWRHLQFWDTSHGDDDRKKTHR